LGDKETGDRNNKVIAGLARANNLQGFIDVADSNDGSKLGTGKDIGRTSSVTISPA
jgi:hypothetical protein